MIIKNYYCNICGKTIKRKSKTKHIKSKGHSYMNSSVREKHTLGDVYWNDFEGILHHYINVNILKFPFFKTLIECDLYGENIKFSSDEYEMRVRLYGFDGGGNFYYRFCASKKVRDYIYHRSTLMGNELFPESILNNLSITFYSYYYIMIPKYRLQQPKRILESKLLKHIKNLSDFEKSNNYSFLSFIYGLIDGGNI